MKTRIEIRATAIEPIHHGTGSIGNTSLLRQQQIITPDGRPARVPFISGNSLKHRIRYHAVRYMLDRVKPEPGSLTKAEIDLLFSGGSLSKSGSAMDLSVIRRVSEHLPAVSLCGYSVGNVMTSSKVRASHLHLACEENAWRMPKDLIGDPRSGVRAASARSEEFGTRHDSKRGQDATKLLDDQGADSVQMIYSFQVISPGSVFWGSVEGVDLTEHELAALVTAFAYGSEASHNKLPMHVGAKASTGFGLIHASVEGLPFAELAAYDAWIVENREQILATLREVTS